MPRIVRNFWIELEVDGKKTKVATGPRNRNGGFTLNIKVRENGEISTKSVKITGTATGNGKLYILGETFGVASGRSLNLVTER